MLYAQTGRKIHAMQKSFIIFFMVIQGICLLLRDGRNFTFHRMKKIISCLQLCTMSVRLAVCQMEIIVVEEFGSHKVYFKVYLPSSVHVLTSSRTDFPSFLLTSQRWMVFCSPSSQTLMIRP